ncbi:hypothetical protein HK099_003041 [Clydaea vesicula]|uniref:C2H2-type domain-containing protein n=1 Tax=Clydaea vesicula TaxID=447962 RepID=A0AAD5XUF1_9FUNG|nr:hypothetical protein HK099_003041 [Clydaea vesicula]
MNTVSTTEEIQPHNLQVQTNKRKLQDISENLETSVSPIEKQDKSNTSKKFLCTFGTCGKSFSTSGHLSRHARIHTGTKSFKCLIPECDSFFSRHDNMMQHYRTHSKKLAAMAQKGFVILPKYDQSLEEKEVKRGRNRNFKKKVKDTTNNNEALENEKEKNSEQDNKNKSAPKDILDAWLPSKEKFQPTARAAENKESWFRDDLVIRSDTKFDVSNISPLEQINYHRAELERLQQELQNQLIVSNLDNASSIKSQIENQQVLQQKIHENLTTENVNKLNEYKSITISNNNISNNTSTTEDTSLEKVNIEKEKFTDLNNSDFSIVNSSEVVVKEIFEFCPHRGCEEFIAKDELERHLRSSHTNNDSDQMKDIGF